MGNEASRHFFPTTVLDCTTANAVEEGARYDYQCATEDRVRYGLTLVHLLTLVVILLLSLLLYLVYWRICQRRVYAQLRAVPKRLPVGRDVLSLRMHTTIIDGFARVSRDVYCPTPHRPVPPPPALAAAPGDRARFRAGVYAALQRLSVSLRAALADELHLLRDGLRGARGVLVGPRFRAAPDDVELVLAAMTLAGLDYRGDVEGPPPGEGEGEEGREGGSDGADDGGDERGAGAAPSDATAQPAAARRRRQAPPRVTVDDRGVAHTEAAVDAIVAALEAATGSARSGRASARRPSAGGGGAAAPASTSPLQPQAPADGGTATPAPSARRPDPPVPGGTAGGGANTPAALLSAAAPTAAAAAGGPGREALRTRSLLVQRAGALA